MNDRANQLAANANAMHACPACGEWLPLEMTRFRCGGVGHHVEVPPDSLTPPPSVPIVVEPASKAPDGTSWADKVLLVFVLAVLLTMAVALLGMLFPRH